MNVQQMIADNTRLRKQLTAENKEYYEEMVVYIRTSHVSEVKTEELLLEILQHLLEAQKAGRSAVEVFGDQPAEYCRELVEQLPKPGLRENLKMIFLVLWCSATWVFLTPVLQGIIAWISGSSMAEAGRIHSATFLFQFALSSIFIWLLLKVINRFTFSKQKRKAGWQLFALTAGITLILLVLLILLRDRMPVFTIQPWISTFILAFGLLGIRLIFLRK